MKWEAALQQVLFFFRHVCLVVMVLLHTGGLKVHYHRFIPPPQWNTTPEWMSENGSCVAFSLKSPDLNPHFYEEKKTKKKTYDFKLRYTCKIAWITICKDKEKIVKEHFESQSLLDIHPDLLTYVSICSQ